MGFRGYMPIVGLMWAYYGLLTAAQSIHGLAHWPTKFDWAYPIHFLNKEPVKKPILHSLVFQTSKVKKTNLRIPIWVWTCIQYNIDIRFIPIKFCHTTIQASIQNPNFNYLYKLYNLAVSKHAVSKCNYKTEFLT
jgi:hypothetical protein